MPSFAARRPFFLACLFAPSILAATFGACAADNSDQPPPDEATATSGSGAAGGTGSSAGGEGGLGIDAGDRDGGTGGLDRDAACAKVKAEADVVTRPIDAILIVDNSGSMGDDIIAVQNNINSSFAAILGAAGVDYRVIVLSLHGWSDTAEAICIEPPLSNQSCTPIPAMPGNNPPVFFHYSKEIASRDSWCKLLATFDGTLPDDFGFAPMGWSEWLRDDAFKAFIELSDDGILCDAWDDLDNVAGGNAVAASFDTALLAKSPLHFGDAANRNYVWHGILGMPAKLLPSEAWDPADPIQLGTCPTGATPGTGHQALSILTGGLRFPICEHPSYDVVFQAIAASAIAGAGIECAFPVPAPPPGQTIDLASVQVEYTPGDGSMAQTFDQVDDPTGCGPGKFYIASDSIVLCPETCSVVQKDEMAKVLVLFDCEVPPR